MENFADKVETFLDKQLELYGSLESVFETEKKQLTDMDVEGLWATVAAKKQILGQLTEINRSMMLLIQECGWYPDKEKEELSLSDFISHLPVPQNVKRHLKQIKSTIEHCRDKVFASAMANKHYVQESLLVINDIFTIAKDANSQKNYNVAGQIQNSNATRLINTEV